MLNKLHNTHELDGISVPDRTILSVLIALKICGLNVFANLWKPNTLTYILFALLISFWVTVVSNFFLKVISSSSLDFPEDIHFLYIGFGITNAAVQTYILIRGKKALRRIYGSIFGEFNSWLNTEEKLAVYEAKSSRMNMWVWYAGGQLYAAVVLMMLRPLSDGSDFPLPRNLVYIPGVDYDKIYIQAPMYIIQIMMMSAASGLLYTTDSMFMLMTSHISAHLFLLGEHLEEAGHSGNHGRIQRSIQTFVDRYNAIYKCMCRMSYVYGPQNWFLPVYTMLFSTVTLIAFDGTLSTFSCLGLAISHMFRLLTFCLPAEIILTENELLYRRIMWCGFHKWPVMQQKSILFVLQRLKHPLGVRCGLNHTFSMQLWYSTMSTIYSLYNTVSRFKNTRK